MTTHQPCDVPGPPLPPPEERREENTEESDGTGSDWSSSDRYKPVEKIGVGAYGVVFKARDLRKDGEFVAMKCLRVENTEQGIPLSMLREIALLRQLDSRCHPNVVRLLDICPGQQTPRETQLMLVFEHVEQDLDMFLNNSPDILQISTIQDVMRQILHGIDFLHSRRVIHRDLKPQNILITADRQVKIADFGLARIYSIEMALTAVVVTLWYRSPEVLLQDSYASPVDLWSVGCIFAELYNKKALFRGSGDVNQLKKIFNFIGRPGEEEWPPDVAIPITSFPSEAPKSPIHFIPCMDADARDLLMKLLKFDPDQRPTASIALEHKYFKHTQLPPSQNSPIFNEDIPSSSSGYRRLPYAQQMTASLLSKDAQEASTYSGRYFDERYGYDLGHSGYDCADSSENDVPDSIQHSTITPDLQQITTSESPPIKQENRKRRSFGDTLPVLTKDGASGFQEMKRLSNPNDESAFLTPPSDLASSSSELVTSSSSRSSTPPSSCEDLPASTTSPRPMSTIPSAEAPKLRTRKSSESEQSRMSWTLGDTQDSYFLQFEPEPKHIPKLFASMEPSFKTPTDQMRYPDKSIALRDSVESKAPSCGHSSQSSYSSSEGDSQNSLPRPEK